MTLTELVILMQRRQIIWLVCSGHVAVAGSERDMDRTFLEAFQEHRDGLFFSGGIHTWERMLAKCR